MKLMKVLYAPFAARMPSLGGKPSPKDYPFAEELAQRLEEKHWVIQVAGQEDPQVASVIERNPSFSDLKDLIKGSDAGVCVDSYLQHYFWYLGRCAVVIFGISDPLIFGHPENINLLRDRKYLRAQQFDWYYTNQYNNDAFVSPQEILDSLKNIA